MKDKFYEMAKNAILSDIETRNTQEFLGKIQSNIATEKALADFRKLSKLDKFFECQHYGVIISNTDITTTDGYLTMRIMEIYNTEFAFILIDGEVTGCYELQ